MSELSLPTSFKERVVSTFGHPGEIWISNLPTLIGECEKRFNIKIGKSFAHLFFNVIAGATQADGRELVIKLCVPNNEVVNEINTLKFMRGHGIVKLLGSDSQRGILLLERLRPGEMLTTIPNDIEATHIAADIMKKTWKPIASPHAFTTTEKWFDRLKQGINLPIGFPAALIDKAKDIAMNLHQNMGEPVLLHGDLHHFNIISAQRQPWLAIDPKGVVKVGTGIQKSTYTALQEISELYFPPVNVPPVNDVEENRYYSDTNYWSTNKVSHCVVEQIIVVYEIIIKKIDDDDDDDDDVVVVIDDVAVVVIIIIVVVCDLFWSMLFCWCLDSAQHLMTLR